MSWSNLDDLAQLEGIVKASAQRPQLIFKHSTRCGISAAAKRRFDADLYALGLEMDLLYLDLLSNRAISNAIAERLGVMHESPQAILLIGEAVAYQDSHYDIDPEQIRQLARKHNLAKA